MKNIDFHSSAIEFVRKNNCAATTPVALIEEAMKTGAGLIISETTSSLRAALEELKEQRRQNVGTHEVKQIQIP